MLNRIAKNHAASAAQVSLAWCMRKPVLAIPKTGSVSHLEEHSQASGLTLSAEEFGSIAKAFPPPRRKQRLAML